MKTCTRCKEEFPATSDYFGKMRDASDGFYPQCWECKRKSNREADTRRKFTTKRIESRKKVDRARNGYEHRKALSAKVSKRWAKNNPEKRRASAAKRRAIKKGATVEDFTPQDVLDKWGTDCHICKKPVDLLDWHMEHVVALVNGGEHSLENVKPSHPKCNLSKGTK